MTFFEKLNKICPNTSENEPMSKHTTFRIGGCADFFSAPENSSQLLNILTLCKENQVPYMILGNGSNLLVSDLGIEGVVVSLSNLSNAEICNTSVFAEAGILMPRLASILMNGGLSGFEKLSGIPGTLGGAIYMNAGAYGSEIKDIVKSVTYIDENLTLQKAFPSELDFGYRKSMFSGTKHIILSAELEFAKKNPDEIKKETAVYTEKRTSKQPLNFPSAGSTFKRPEGYFAGDLIERAELKGYRIGGAEVSEKHAGFIINRQNASAADVMNLIEHIQKTVEEKFSVKLIPEIKITGR